MLFEETRLKGACIIRPERLEDGRGFFARAWCRREFAEHGLVTEVAQCNVAYNTRRGTLRGMHFQRPPHEETKLVRCTNGAVADVIIDLRPQSATFRQWLCVELSADNRTLLYVPKGFAHGYLTLTDEAEIFYQVSEPYAPQAEGGVRYNDPAFGIEWPVEAGMELIISDKDRSWPDFRF